MKQIYDNPVVEIFPVFDQDILTLSTDNIAYDDFDIMT